MQLNPSPLKTEKSSGIIPPTASFRLKSFFAKEDEQNLPPNFFAPDTLNPRPGSPGQTRVFVCHRPWSLLSHSPVFKRHFFHLHS